MLRIDILSVIPNLIESNFRYSIVKRAQDKGLVQVNLHDLHNFSTLPHRKVDDYPYGGEAGMVLSLEPIVKAIRHLQNERHYDAIIYFRPDAPTWNQNMANYYSLKSNIILLCGHYKGIDERICDLFDLVSISLGAFVLSGGELVASVFVDSVVRLIPGVLGDIRAALSDSFQDTKIAAPVYTRPRNFEGKQVPEVLLSGNPKKINQWQEEQAELRSQQYNNSSNNNSQILN